jgi:ATP-binding cassette subfamily B protein
MFIFKGSFYLGFNNIDVLLFLLFNPLQELGNVIATYNETKVSMDILPVNSKAKRSQQVKTIGAINHLRFSNISFKHQSAASYAVQDIFLKHSRRNYRFCRSIWKR